MSVHLLVLCLALLQQGGRARPDPPGCNSPEVVRVAEEALEQINQDRTDGYILTLNRLYDLSHETGGSFYKLTIDVMETICHITSRKPWKQCEVRDISDVPVYGECEVSASVDSQVKLLSYSCALREVPATAVVDVCPDCPTAENLEEPVVKETANLSLQRFNEESRLANYFTLENVTRASSQWVNGPSYFVEFTILETVCLRTTEASELSSCPPMDCPFQAHAKADSGHTGHQHHNHTHLHPHEHTHSVTPGADLAVSESRGALGIVVERAAPLRSSPSASACPGQRRHRLGLDRLKL
uniref:Si:ch211-284e20.8 n=1 Tax=Cyclopterus lumpus TaxID=8103 RepID=A0A8C3A1M8_CYCLU